MLRQSYKLFKLSLTNNKKPILTNLSVSVVLEVISVYLLYLLNQQYGILYEAIQNYDTKNIWGSIANFSILAMILVGVNGYLGYFIARLAFEVRTGLTVFFLNLDKLPEHQNIDQRIQEDLKRFGESACEFWFAVFKALLYLPVFLGIVITLTEWYVGLAVFVAVVIGTWLTKIVANRLVKEQAIQENNEANFRKNLTKDNYNIIVKKFFTINKIFKYLSFTQSGLGQGFALLPFILLMPLYISKAITMGAFFQAVNALGKIIDSLSILIDSRQVIVEIETCLYRLRFVTKKD
jgi:ABC-type uncharacterized transport system fused permease/ATPase subunit